MNKRYPIDVMVSGAVVLGEDVVCDGFHCERPFRVQTHVHEDHMHEFDTSKGYQDLYMSEPTLSLLRAEYNADLEVRDNLFSLPLGTSHELRGGSRLTLLSSEHMLGAVQAMLETPGGLRLGYSGDFHWPMDRVMEVEALVVDATYGSPDSVREYTQEEAEERLLQLVLRRAKQGPVHIKAHRGTIQRALQILAGNTSVPLIGSDALCKEVRVYQKFGCAVGTLLRASTPEAKAAIEGKRYVRLYRTKKEDRFPKEPDGTTIVLSGFMASKKDPVLEYSERAFSVALSNHADFWGTVEYVRATGARYVVTDNTRMNGATLANELSSRLGIHAVPSSTVLHRGWGQ